MKAKIAFLMLGCALIASCGTELGTKSDPTTVTHQKPDGSTEGSDGCQCRCPNQPDGSLDFDGLTDPGDVDFGSDDSTDPYDGGSCNCDPDGGFCDCGYPDAGTDPCGCQD